MVDIVIRNLMNTYVELGIAEIIDEETIKSMGQDYTVEFEGIYGDDSIIGIRLFNDGLHIDDIDLDDADFSAKINELVFEGLNI